MFPCFKYKSDLYLKLINNISKNLCFKDRFLNDRNRKSLYNSIIEIFHIDFMEL